MSASQRNQLKLGLATNIMTMAMTFNLRLLNQYPSDFVNLLYTTNKNTLHDAVHPTVPYAPQVAEQSTIPVFSRSRPEAYLSCNNQTKGRNDGSSQYDDKGGSIRDGSNYYENTQSSASVRKEQSNRTYRVSPQRSNGQQPNATCIRPVMNATHTALPQYQSFIPQGRSSTIRNQPSNVTNRVKCATDVTYTKPGSSDRSRNMSDSKHQRNATCNMRPGMNALPQQSMNVNSQYQSFVPPTHSSSKRIDHAPCNATYTIPGSPHRSRSTSDRNEPSNTPLSVRSSASRNHPTHTISGSPQRSMNNGVPSSAQRGRSSSEHNQQSRNNNLCASTNKCKNSEKSKVDETIKAVIEQFMDLSKEERQLFVDGLQHSNENSVTSGQNKLDSTVKAVIDEFIDLSKEEKELFIQSFQEPRESSSESEEESSTECSEEPTFETVLDSFLELSAEEQNSFVQNLDDEPTEENEEEECEEDVALQLSTIELFQRPKLNEFVDAVMQHYLKLSEEDKKLFLENLQDPNTGDQPCEEEDSQECEEEAKSLSCEGETQTNSVVENLMETFLKLSTEAKKSFVDSFIEPLDESKRLECEDNESPRLPAIKCERETSLNAEVENLVEKFLELSTEDRKSFVNSFIKSENCEEDASPELPAIKCEPETEINEGMENLMDKFLELSTEDRKSFINSFIDAPPECKREPQSNTEVEHLVETFLELSSEDRKLFVDSFNEPDEEKQQEYEEDASPDIKCERETSMNEEVENLMDKFMELSSEDRKFFVDSFNEPDEENCQEFEEEDASQELANIKCERETSMNEEVENLVDTFLELSKEDRKSFINSFIQAEEGNEESDDANMIKKESCEEEESDEFMHKTGECNEEELKSKELKAESPYCCCPHRKSKGHQAAAKIKKILHTVRTYSGNTQHPSACSCRKR